MDIKTFSAATLSLLLTTTLATAGGHDTLGRSPTTVIAAPSVQSNNWNGGYIGLSFGPNITNELTDSSGVFEAEETTTFGLFGGYQMQSGALVYGGEIAFSSSNDMTFEFEGTEIATGDYNITDLKARAGFALNNALVYGVGGYSIVSSADDSDGFNFGIGAEYKTASNLVIGIEYLARQTTFDDNDDVDANLDTLSIRAAFSY